MSSLGGHIRGAIRILALALVLLVVPAAAARAQVYGYGGYGYASPAYAFGYAAPTYGFGYGYPGPAISYAYGYPAVGFGGTPAFGLGYGYGYPAYSYAFYGNVYGAPVPYTPLPAGYGNPLFAAGLTPLGVQGALADAYLMGSTRKAGTAYIPAARQYYGTGSARPPVDLRGAGRVGAPSVLPQRPAAGP